MLSLSELCAHEPNIDSLKSELKKAKHDTTKIHLRFDIGVAEGNFRIAYWDSLANDAKKASSKKYEAGALNNLGYIYDDLGDIPMAIECYKKGLKIQEDIGHKIGIATTLNNLGQIYKKQGDISRGLECYHRSLHLEEEQGDKGARAVTLNNIGGIYSLQGDLLKALDCFEKSLKLNEETDDKKGIAQSLNNIGMAYKKLGNIDKALESYNRSLLIRKIVGDKRGLAFVLNNIGGIYSMQGRTQKALDCLNMSLEISEGLGEKRGVAQALNSIANTLVQKGEPQLAFSYANRSMQMAKELGFPENIENSAKILKTIFQMQNKYKAALEMYELEIKMSDSINNQETQKITVKKQMQYTYEKRELQMKADQDKKDVISIGILNQKEKERNYFIAGFGLVIILVLFILRSYTQKQKANALIRLQKQMVEEKQKEILDSIHYAKRIQNALMMSEKNIESVLKKLQMI